MRRSLNSKLMIYLGVSTITLFGLWLRLFRIADIPIGGHGDVSWIGINALDWLQAGIWPYYIYELYAPEPLIVYAAAFSIQIFGPSFFASRMPTVIASLLVVPTGFAAARYLTHHLDRITQQRTIWLFTIGYAVSFYPIVLGKTGQRSQLFPFQLALMTALFGYAWHSGKRWAFAATAIVLALMNYTYIPARLVPILLCVWVLHQFFADRVLFRTRLVNFTGMMLFSALLVTPQLVTYLQTPEAFFARSNQDAGQLIFISGLRATDLILTLLAKFGAQFGIFVLPWRGFYSEMGRALLPLTLGIGAFIGIAFALVRLKDKSFWWPLTGILFMVLTDVVSGTQTEPHGLRMIGVLPFAFLLGSRGLTAFWVFIEQRLGQPQKQVFNRTLGILIPVSIIGIGLFDFTTYHQSHIPALQAQVGVSDRLEATDVFIAELIKQQGDEYPILITWDDYTRANIVYLLSDAYPERTSSIVQPDEIALPVETQARVLLPITPFRPRHDGLPPEHDWQSWVMLYQGQMIMLPPTTSELIQPEAIEPIDTIEDWQGNTIAEIGEIGLSTVEFQSIAVSDANFNNELRLAGHNLLDKQLTPGQKLWVTLYWQAVNGAAEDYETYVQILNDQGEPIAQAHRWTLDGVYRTRLWPDDQLTPTRFLLNLPEDLSPGRYTVIAGPYSVLRNVPVPVVDDQGNAVATHARIERLKVPLDQQIELPSVDRTIRFEFEQMQVFQLIGLEVNISARQLTIQTNWQANATLVIDHTLFIHVVDENNQIVAQLDTQPRSGAYPTGIWDAGEVIPDRYQIDLSNLPAGTYSVYLGWYTQPSGERLTALIDDAPVTDNRVEVFQSILE